MRLIHAFALALIAATGGTAVAQPAVLLDPVRLRPEGLSEYASDGFSVALTDEFAFVGAPSDTVGPPRFPEFPDQPLNRSGSVYIFKKGLNEFELVDRIVGRYEILNVDHEEFGWSISAIKSDNISRILVGSRNWMSSGPNGRGRGRAYIFKYFYDDEIWREEVALRPPVVGPSEDVGASVALVASKFGLIAILGAPGYQPSPDGPPYGRAYIFTQDPATGTWTEAAALENCLVPGQAVSGLIGESVAATVTPGGVVVALGGRQIIDVATFNNSSGGCIYARDDTGAEPGPWTLQASLMPDPPDQNGSLRVSVSAGSDPSGHATVVMGPVNFYQGYVYERVPGESAWRQAQTLDEPGADAFGTQLAQGQIGTSEALIVGATFDQRFGPNAGAAYLYRRDVGASMYAPVAVMSSREDLDYANLGRAVAISASGWAAVTTTAPRPPDFEGRTYLYDVSSLFPVAAEAEPVSAGERLAIAGANPARGTAAVTFDLVEGGPVTVDVVDLLGRVVVSAVSRDLGPGDHRETFSIAELPGGMYVVRLVAGARRESARLVVAR